MRATLRRGRSWRRLSRWAAVASLLLVLCVGLTSCLERKISEDALIAYHVLYEAPDNRGLAYENVILSKPNGERLHAWWVPREHALGCVLLCHGNLVNMSYLVSYIERMHEAGFQVMLFDYQGFAHSSGRFSIKELLADAEAAWQWLENRPDVDGGRIVVYGYSLGSPIALALAANHPAAAGVVVEGLIAPDRLMDDQLGKASPFMSPLVKEYVFPPDWDPRAAAADIGERPLLIINRQADVLADDVEIFLAAAPATRRYLRFPDASHVSFLIDTTEYQQQLRQFLLDCVRGTRPPAATVAAVTETEREYVTEVALENMPAAAGPLPATILLFHRDRVVASFQTWVEPGQDRLELHVPREPNGMTTDDATARFHLDGEFPGWSLRSRAIRVPGLHDSVRRAVKYTTGKAAIRKRMQRDWSFRPEAASIALQYSPVRTHAPLEEIHGRILVEDEASTTEPQPFLAERWERREWSVSSAYPERAAWTIHHPAGIDRAGLIHEIAREEGDDWIYSLRRLMMVDGLLPPSDIQVELYTELGVNVIANPMHGREFLPLLEPALGIPDGIVQKKLQDILHKHFPDIDFLPPPREAMLPPDILAETRAWLRAHAGELAFDIQKRKYRLPASRRAGENFLDQAPVEVDFDLDPKQKNVLSFAFDRRIVLGHERRVITLTLDDPVAAMYALLTDSMLDLIERNFPGTRRDLLACVAAKLGATAGEGATVESLRAWFEANHRELMYDAETRLFVRRDDRAGAGTSR